MTLQQIAKWVAVVALVFTGGTFLVLFVWFSIMFARGDFAS